MSNFYYHAYGLYFETNHPLPNLIALDGFPFLDLSIHLCQEDCAPLPFPSFGAGDWQPHPRHMDRRADRTDADETPALSILLSADEQFTAFHYYDDVQFIFSHDGLNVWGYWPKSVSFEYMVTYLMNPVLGFNLRLRHQVCLHASGIILDGRAILFAGMSGAGKSTTAGFFATQGHTVVTDDISPLVYEDDQVLVYPGYPHLRLYSNSAGALVGAADGLPQIAPDWSKRFLDLQSDRYRFASEPMPVGAVYMITGRENTATIGEVAPSQALIDLMKNTYMEYLLDRDMRAADFKLLAQLSQSVPVRSLSTPQNLSALPELYDAIIADFADCSSYLPVYSER